ncbi:hypothetical protein LTR36_003480 [Oleoguttula mirabilis]|uniref:Uncharacterized protein n=1 Tax=Oleoguttula mirabilis TaxID=1507867 RepID=A0AAV9JK64_9PEZI|nr:hypothetical protein LTR36_003480 [Oleoguttula mirabilis]
MDRMQADNAGSNTTAADDPQYIDYMQDVAMKAIELTYIGKFAAETETRRRKMECFAQFKAFTEDKEYREMVLKYLADCNTIWVDTETRNERRIAKLKAEVEELEQQNEFMERAALVRNLQGDRDKKQHVEDVKTAGKYQAYFDLETDELDLHG